jgi:DNA-binding CsgD family transcriptional regulator
MWVSTRRLGVEDFGRLTGLAYEAGADPTCWPAFLAAYAETLGDRTASLSHHDLASGTGELTVGYRTEPEWERSYAENYAALNPWTSRGAAQMQTGSVLVSHSVISDRELKRTSFHRGFLEEQDVLYSLAAVIERTRDTTTFLSVQRSEKRGAFGDAEIRFVTPLMPHLHRAIELHRRVGSVRVLGEALVDVAERLRYGVFLVDHRNAVLFANAAATRLGRPTIQRVLAIAECGDGVVTDADARSLVVRVAPLRGPRDLLGVPGAARVIFVVAPGQSRLPTATALRDIYAITPAEARVVLALARGATLREIADELGTSVATVRTQVKSSLEKTGTRRQAELVALVHSLAPPL